MLVAPAIGLLGGIVESRLSAREKLGLAGKSDELLMPDGVRSAAGPDRVADAHRVALGGRRGVTPSRRDPPGSSSTRADHEVDGSHGQQNQARRLGDHRRY